MNKEKKSRHRSRRGREKDIIEEGRQLAEDLYNDQKALERRLREVQDEKDPSQEDA